MQELVPFLVLFTGLVFETRRHASRLLDPTARLFECLQSHFLPVIAMTLSAELSLD